jgi:prepilin signal peptidase PulO-like enzyme (type II secretory pathway)
VLSFAYLAIGTILFWLGAAVGSFINVFVYRSIHAEDWVTGQSRCEHCKQKIAWYDLVPVLAYFWLGGKCRYCKHKISLIHPIIESLVGLLFVWWYFIGTLFFRLSDQPFQAIQPAYWLLAGIILVIILVADILYLIVPDLAVMALLSLTLLYRGALVWGGRMQPQDLLYSVISMVVLVVVFYALHFGTRGKGFGLGDVKLAAPLALILGWPKVLVGIFMAFLFGALVGLILILSGKRRFGQVIPFAPFLIAGTLLALVFGGQIWQSYLSLL